MSKECLVSFGVMTDNHLNPEHPELAERSLAAFRLMHKLKPDLLIDCGDITDFWQPGELKNFQRMFRETFSDNAPQKLWLLAGHDVLKHPDYWGGYPEGLLYIGMEDTIPVRRVKGYSFVGVFQCGDYAEFEKKLQQEIAISAGKPVFAVTHEPAYDTVLYSDYGKNKNLRNILNKYPTVIHISGHTHQPIRHERNIWQGEFTAFNAGALTFWKDMTCGRESRRHQSYDALFCRLYADRLEVRRFNVMTQAELAPPWVIPLPFNPATAPYAPERRKNKLPVAEFEDPEPLNFSGSGYGVLTIKNAVPYSSVLRYRVTLFEEDGEVAVLDFYPGTWEGAGRENEEDFYFPPGMLRSGRKYRCSVCALNYFDRAGKSVEYCFSAPEMPLEQLPVSGIGPILSGEETISAAPDGSYEIDGKNLHGYRITLPEELIQYYDKNVVMVLDISCEHTGCPAMIMACGEKPDFGRHFLPPGKEKKHRHCFDLSSLKGDQRFLLLSQGDAGKYYFENIKFFIFPK